MGGLISIWLDVLRFLAALGVFLWHAEHMPISSGVLPHIYFNHKLVIIFFVISGYVIAASANRPDRTAVNYSADRLARLSSVVIPALGLTYLLDGLGVMLSPEVYSTVNPSWQSVRLLLNLVYCQQLWFLCVNPSSNNPFWSLGYEFWYYVLFGIWIFVRPLRARIFWLAVVALFIGPKILLLLPAWAVGALAFHATKAIRLSAKAGWGWFLGSGVALVGAMLYEDQIGLSNAAVGLPPLYYSANYMADNLFAVIVAVNFFACGALSQHLKFNADNYRAGRLIRWLASHTFSLYVYHIPLLLFVCALTKYNPRNPVAVWGCLLVTLVAIGALSKVTEEQYPRIRLSFRRGLAWLKTRRETMSLEAKLQVPAEKS